MKERPLWPASADIHWIDRVGRYLPTLPSERQWVTLGIFILTGSMLKMAEVEPILWRVDLFKTLLTLVVGSALVNMVVAFHFAANKSQEKAAENTGEMARAMQRVTDLAAPTDKRTANDYKQAGAEEAAEAAGEVAEQFGEGKNR